VMAAQVGEEPDGVEPAAQEISVQERERGMEIVERALDDALLAMVPPRGGGLRRKLKLFYSGARIELASKALHRARAELFMLYEPYELEAQAEALQPLVSALPESGSVMKTLTGILAKIRGQPEQLTLAVRVELRQIYERTASVTEALQRESRILRNALIVASAALFTVTLLLGALHAVNTEIISVCSKPASSTTSFCPMGPGSERFDVFAVELAGPLAFLVERTAVAEIGAGAKRLALRGQHHCAAFGVLVERLESAGDFLDQRDVEKIIRRPADLDQRHGTGFLDGDILEWAHGIIPCVFSLGRAVLRRRRLLLDDQGVHDGNTLPLGVHDDRIKVDLRDLVGMIRCEK